MASFRAVRFQLDVLDEIGGLIEPASEGFLTYSFIQKFIIYSTQHLQSADYVSSP